MKALDQFIDKSTARYVGLEVFLEELVPQSEEAKLQALRPRAYEQGDEDALRAHHLRVEAAIALLADDPALCDRLMYHLRELPRLGDIWELSWGQAEFALLAAFLHHQHHIRALLPSGALLSSWLELVAPEQLDEGLLGDPARAHYYLEDDASEKLAAARMRVRRFRRNMEDGEQALRRRLSGRYGLPANAAEWVIDRSSKSLVKRMLADEEAVLLNESVASLRFGVRPDKALVRLQRDYERALSDEREAERAIWRDMEKKMRARADLWRAEQDKLIRLDLVFAHAAFARKWRGKAPEILSSEHPGLIVENGRHIGIARGVERDGGDYQPLEIELSEAGAILTGTNMGGKTVTMQSLGAFQALAQLGFFTPAVRFRTRLYSGIFGMYSLREKVGGLSGFGREIERLRLILPERVHGAFYLIDEPGRTTHVNEGRAITQALIDAIAESPSFLFVATHLDRLESEKLGHLKMAGLRREELSAMRRKAGEGPVALHRLMDYRVIRGEPGVASGSDALDVAELLGLEASLLIRARELLKREEGKGE